MTFPLKTAALLLCLAAAACQSDNSADLAADLNSSNPAVAAQAGKVQQLQVQLEQQQATIEAEKQKLQAMQQQLDGARENLTGLKRQTAATQ